MNDPQDTQDPEAVLDEQDLLLEMVRAIVRHSDRVKIEAVRGEKTSLLSIYVDPEDRGQVIGKGHQTLEALQHIMMKTAFLDGERKVVVQLEGHQPQAQRYPQQDRPYRPKPGFNRQYNRQPSRNG